MIIFSNKPGQLGNMLFIYANLLAYGIAHQVRVSNPAFYDYQRYFEGTQAKSDVLAKFAYRLSFFIARVLHKLKIRLPFLSMNYLDWNESLDLDRSGKQFKNRLCFLQGWQYRAPESTRKHEAEIRAFFAPVKQHVIAMDDFFKNTFHSVGEVIIGVHIRRGDYKHFENGRYFYSIAEYRKVMEKIVSLFPGQKLHFLVCSNESLVADDLSIDGAVITMAMNHELLDMYSMARCRYIIGPPSTYSMWASVYGNVPLYKICDPAREITLKDFAVHSSF
jgi:hypothetical protein